MSLATRHPYKVTIIDRSLEAALSGPSFRSQRLGPELELLERFLNAPLFDVPAGCEVIIFREPRLPSGFPDLVIVIWDRKKTARWHPARWALTPKDVRVAHFLYHEGLCTDEKLRSVFGGSASKSMARLYAAGVLEREESICRLRPLKHVFAARQIIAVEAKISEWKVGLEQALMNTWFASASYMLVPNVSNKSSLWERARDLGIGVWAEDRTAVKPQMAQRLPCSYASWLFNEWAWRVSLGNRENGKWCSA